jgi:hypothetical protein
MEENTPLLGQGGVAAPLIKKCEATLAGADGVVGSTTAHFINQHHPVCAINGGFAAFY